jgi:tRNA dimethylallyltransferase
MAHVAKRLLVCIVGPTAIGKTALAIELAKRFSTEIISADSRQFFKEMTIGTAVPTKEELAAVPHHFVQDKSIFEPYSVGDFERDALQLLEQLFETHRLVILVGGSGLYVDAVVKGLDTFPAVPPAVREQLNTELDRHGVAHLQQELLKVDPVYYEKVDVQNPHRLIRALEIYRATGKPYSQFLDQGREDRNFNTCYIGLEAERNVVYDRINRRVDLMMQQGLLDEAKTLYEHRHLNALQTVGYRELFDYMDGKSTLNDAISEIKKNTRRFAKRQGTWFRKNHSIKWFEHTTPPHEIGDYIEAKNALL